MSEPEDDRADDAREEGGAPPPAEERAKAAPSPKPSGTARAGGALRRPEQKKSFLARHGLAVGLSAALVGGGFYVLVIDSGSLSTEESELRKNMLLPAWRVDDLRRVDVTLPEARYAIERNAPDAGASEGRWSVSIEDQRFPAEEQVVDRFLSVMAHVRVVRRVAAGSVDRAELGLDQPRAELKLDMGSLSFTVRVGKPTPTGDGVYAELVGKGIVVIPVPDANQLEVQPGELRSTTFVPYLSTQLASLTLEGEGGKRVFERAPWGGGRGSGFRFGEGGDGPKGQRVDGGRLDAVLVSFGRMQSGTILDEAAATAALEPRVVVTMTPKGGQPQGVIEIGGACPGKEAMTVAVRRAPSVLAACVPDSVLPALTRPAEDFVDDGVLGAAVDEIVELRMARGAKVLEMARLGTGFKVRHPEERDIDADTGNEVLKDMVAARGSEAPADLAMPADPVTVRVTSQGGIAEGGGAVTRVEELEVGQLPNGKLLVLRKEDGTRILLDEAVGSVFTPSDLLLRELTVVDARPLDISSLSVEHDGVRQRIARQDGELVMLEPKGTGLTPDEIFSLTAFNVFSKLKATRWVAEEAKPSFGLDKPRFRIEAEIDDGDGKKTLAVLLGAKTDDGVYAKLDGQPGVFFVDGFTEGAFDKNFVSREALKIDPAALDSVTLVAGGARLRLARKGRQLAIEGGSEAKSQEVVKALEEIAALTAVSTGPAKKEYGLDAPGLSIELVARKNSAGDRGGSVKIVFGASDTVGQSVVRYARRGDVDATFAVPALSVERLVSLVERR